MFVSNASADPYRFLPFTEIYIFRNKYILIIIRKTFQVEVFSGTTLTELALLQIYYNMEIDRYETIIRQFTSEENGTDPHRTLGG